MKDELKQLERDMKKIIKQAYDLGKKESFSDALRNAKNYRKDRGGD